MCVLLRVDEQVTDELEAQQVDSELELVEGKLSPWSHFLT